MAKCGWCIDGFHTCAGGGTGWRCDCGCPVRVGHRHVGAVFSWTCPLGCNWGRPFKTFEEAETAQVNHACAPRKGADMTTRGKSIIEQGWEQLDSQVDEIMALTAKAQALEPAKAGEYTGRIAVAKAAARGKAEILALMTVPHFRTTEEVSTEAGARWKARQAGTPHVTPGLGS